MRSVARPAFLFGLILLVVVPACGGEGGLSKEEFIAKADPICANANEEADALGPRPIEEGEADWWSEFVAIGQSALKELRALSPAEEEQRAVHEILSNFERAYAWGADRAAALRGGDNLSADVALGWAWTKMLAAWLRADRYGLQECAQLGYFALGVPP